MVWPFAIDPSGNVATTTASGKVWADRVAAAIGTRLGERVMRSSFGSMVPDGLFADSEADATDVQGHVATTFSQWLPQLTLSTVQVAGPDSSGVLRVDIDYNTPNALPGQASVVVGTVSQDGTFTEVAL
jgi:phage baseplate assembly protein W